MRLFWQLLGTFAVLIVFAVSGTSVLNGVTYQQIATRNFERGVPLLQMELARTLSDYYVAHDHSWAGVDTRLQEIIAAVHWTRGASPAWALVDQNGAIAAQGGARGNLVPSDAVSGAGVPIVVEGKQVGKIVVFPASRSFWFGGRGRMWEAYRVEQFHGADRPTDPRAELPLEPPLAQGDSSGAQAAPAAVAPVPPVAVVREVGRSFMWVALSICSVTLGLAVLLSRRISAPLGRLTAAARQVAGGDLRVEVPGSSIVEVDALAHAFNQMATNLLRADQLRRNMTADIAHELRTPLTVIKGKLEGILDGVYPASPEHLAPVLEEANLLERLIDDLRLLSLAEAGQLPLNREEVEPRRLLENVRQSFAREAARHNVSVSVEAASDMPLIEVDGQRMQQVLGNLVSNSLRHTTAGGQVALRGRHNGHGVILEVADTGTGIPPEQLPHIFDRFWRGDKARSHQGSGAGLGLAIARHLVESHGGQIHADSALGQGTTISIELPVEGTGNR